MARQQSVFRDQVENAAFAVVRGFAATIRRSMQPNRGRLPKASAPPRHEFLEPRTLFTAIVVNTAQDGLFPPATGMISLRNAIATANSAADATTITFDPTVFATAQTITLTGTNLDVNNANSQKITITGPSAGVTIDGNNNSGALKVQSAADISGFTFTHCNTTAVMLEGTAETTLSNCTITDNHGGDSGGGMFVDGVANLNNLTITNNSTDANGYGGGIDASVCTLLLSNCIVTGNTAGNIGGGLYTSGNVSISGSVIAGNSAYGSAGIGNYGNLAVTNTTISGNMATSGIGGLSNYYGNVIAANVTIANNTSPSRTGGIDSIGGSFALSDSTVVGNSSGSGTGGILNETGSYPFTVANSIVAQNTTTGSGTPDASGTFNSSGYNLIGATDGSTGWFSLDQTGTAAALLNPMLGALADNGGASQTMLPSAGSPAIDHGFNGNIAPGISTDQRGLARLSNGTVDIGAVEVQTGSTTPVTTGTLTTVNTNNDNVPAGQNVTLTAMVASNPTGGAPPTGTVNFLASGTIIGSATLDGNGKAVLVTNSIAAGVYSITATYAGDTNYTTSTSQGVSQTITGTVAPHAHLAFASQPLSGQINSALSPTFSVDVKNADDTLNTADSSTVTLSISSGPSGGTIGGTTSVPAVSGVATFPGITFSAAGSYTLTATDGSLTSAISSPIAITSVPSSPIVPTLTHVSVPTTVIGGAKTKGSVTVNITNSAAALKGKYTVALYANLAAALDGLETLLVATSKTLLLKAGKHSTLNLKFSSLPATLAADVYHILAVVTDPTGKTNITTAPQTVTVVAPFVRLSAVAAAVKPTAIKAGKTAAVVVTLTNSGNVDAKGLLDVTATPSTDGITSNTAVQLAILTKKNFTIKAGKSVKLTMHLKTASLAPGIYFPYFSISLNGSSTQVFGSQFTVL